MKEDLCNLVKDLTEFKTDSSSFKSECAQSIKRSLFRVSADYFLKYVKNEPEFHDKYKLASIYLAGLIELLCVSNSLLLPDWVVLDKYFLKSEFCTLTGFDKKVPASIIKSTHECFSKRNYFTNENGILA